MIYDKLIMRDIGDCRKDVDFKQAYVDAVGAENVVCAFDDLPHIVDLMRNNGITTYEVTRYTARDTYVESNAHYKGNVNE